MVAPGQPSSFNPIRSQRNQRCWYVPSHSFTWGTSNLDDMSTHNPTVSASATKVIGSRPCGILFLTYVLAFCVRLSGIVSSRGVIAWNPVGLAERFLRPPGLGMPYHSAPPSPFLHAFHVHLTSDG